MTPRVVAIVAVHNEADVIEQTTVELIQNGVEVVVIDDGSTDGTLDILSPLVGHGVVSIERLPPIQPDRFRLQRILERKETLARTVEADWFINHDADEIRESPWTGVKLADGIALVARLGWNAIDFAVLNFCPTDDEFKPGDDLRKAFPYWTPGAMADRTQIRCWMRSPTVELQSTGGHEARFPDRRIFPIRFLLRHYPIRSQAHGDRKVWLERVPRFSEEERAHGWHVQYQNLRVGQSFVQDPSALTLYDAEAVRIDLGVRNRRLEETAEQLDAMRLALAASQGDASRLSDDLRDCAAGNARAAEQLRVLTGEIDVSQSRERQLRTTLVEWEQRLHDLSSSVRRAEDALREQREQGESLLQAAAAATNRANDLERELTTLRASRSWRWTEPVRRVVSWFGLD